MRRAADTDRDLKPKETLMLSALKQFLKQVTYGDEGKKTFAEDDHRLAAAALLFHVISVDGIVDDVERDKLEEVLKRTYELSDEETAELIAAAQDRDNEAVDLYGFTSVLKRNLDADERLKIVELMWEMVYADGVVHEFEDNTIWRVAELLGVSSRDRLSLRRKVSHEHDAHDGSQER